MSDGSKIEWTDATWNPIRGCSRVSPGCDNCYAIGVAHRFSWGEGLTTIRKGKPDWTAQVDEVHEKLGEPLRWRRPRRVFVCSGADVFHPSVSFGFLEAMFGIMAAARRHTFQVLTKRPARAVEFFRYLRHWADELHHDIEDEDERIHQVLAHRAQYEMHGANVHSPDLAWPLPNVWIGVSAEDQQRWDERVPLLAHQVPAAVKFVSAEPLLGPIDMRATGRIHLDWVIAGAESGHGRRPMNEDWVRGLRDDCLEYGTAFFYKQRIENGRKVGLPELDGQVWSQFPEVAP